MNEEKTAGKEVALENIISSAIQIPGVKVNRNGFLLDIFSDKDHDTQNQIIETGPIQAGISQDDLTRLANKLIIKRTSVSSLASFAAGIPGGLAMAATIPADILQFFGMALRLAQELSYLYGADDLWQDGQIDDEKVKFQLLLYCGVMFGISGAVSGVRVLSAQIAKTALKKLPQKALTKTFWYPIVKQIGKAIGIKITKNTVAKGVSKAVPVIGGIVSGTLNFASMMPMANRLKDALESANFGYTDQDLESDIHIIEAIDVTDSASTSETQGIQAKIIDSGKKIRSTASGLFSRIKTEAPPQNEDVFDSIKKLSELKNVGIISQEEFDKKKDELMARI